MTRPTITATLRVSGAWGTMSYSERLRWIAGELERLAAMTAGDDRRTEVYSLLDRNGNTTRVRVKGNL